MVAEHCQLDSRFDCQGHLIPSIKIPSEHRHMGSLNTVLYIVYGAFEFVLALINPDRLEFRPQTKAPREIVEIR